MSQMNSLNQTASEVTTLGTRGYKLLSVLGKGSYAKVYLSDYRPNPDTSARTLACKVVDTKKVTKNFANKFLPRELDILGKINHPHIIQVHSIFQRRNRYFIFMRFAENGDLLDIMIRDGAISEAQTRFWMRQISLAIQYLHRMQISHRDIKCENILVTRNNNVKLCDFGFTRYVVDTSNKKLLSETFCGSLSYASPEILKGLPYAPKVSDMWAFGVMVFTMLNKAMPFDDTHATKLYDNQMRKRWKFGYRVIDKLSSEVKSMVNKLLEPDVRRRLRIDDVVAHPWFAMDSKLRSLNQYESAALMAANKAASAFDTAEESSDIIIDDRQPKKTGSKTPAAPMEKNDARLGSKEHVATVSPDPAPEFSALKDSSKISRHPSEEAKR